MNKEKNKIQRRKRRQRKIRAKIKGTVLVPRISVFRSLKHISAQAIDDRQGRVLAMADDFVIKSGNKTKRASQVGEKLGRLLFERQLKKVVFDRRGFKYHGRVKALAEGLRQAGLNF